MTGATRSTRWGVLIVLLMSVSLPAARAQSDERAAVELALLRYAQACSASDVSQMYRLGTTELRLLLRMSAVMAGASIDPSQADDLQGFESAVIDAGNDWPRAIKHAPMNPVILKFSRVVDIDIRADRALCYVFDPDAATEANQRRRRPGAQPADVSALPRLLVTAPLPPAAETPPPDPRADATHVAVMRPEDGAWRFSLVARAGTTTGPELGRVRSRSDDLEAVAKPILDAQAGGRAIRQVLRACVTNARTNVEGDNAISIAGPMTDAFKAFVASKTGAQPVHAHVDITLYSPRAGEVYLLQPDEPTIGDVGGLSVRRLWAFMVEHAATQP